MPSISFLVHDIHCPVLGPVTELARALEPCFPVQIVGPDFGHGVCPMYRDAFPYTVVSTPRLYRLPNFLWERERLALAISGDLIISVKAYADTLPVALKVKRQRGAKVVVYLDEWDGALYARRNRWERLRAVLGGLHHPLEDWTHPWVERLIPRADEVVSTTRSLQRRFGGRVIHMGVDLAQFSPPSDHEVADLRKKWGLEANRLVVFGGVVRPHKGIDDVVDALVRMGRPEVKLMVVGPVTEHLKRLQDDPQRARHLIAIGTRPKAEMPSFLAMADLVALPLVDDLLAQSQMPCKVFEAMAMARPIVASEVSDLSEVLNGCGKVVAPGKVDGLVDAIAWILDHPCEASSMGAAARSRCSELYSREATQAALFRLVEDLYEAGAAA